jgi:hypothetical protein
MTRGSQVRLNEDAIDKGVDIFNQKQIGTVLSVCAHTAFVRWANGRTADYGQCWLRVEPGKTDLPEVKPRFDPKLSSRWKR